MKYSSYASIAALAFVLTVFSAGPSAAHDFKVGDLAIDHPTARINIGDRPSAGYMTIKNTGDAADRLISASSPAFGRIELHTHIKEDGVVKMRAVDTIEAPADGSVALEPGGLHLMLFEPTEALGEDGLIPMTLVFENAGTLDVTFIGEKIGGKTKGAHKGHDHGAHKHGDGDASENTN